MGKTLYLDCSSGISGDMVVAALLDLGADKKVLSCALDSLNVNGFEIEIKRVKKAGLDVCDFSVKLDAHHENHDHDMDYLYGKKEHDHSHDESHIGHAHEHRGLSDILEIIRNADMSAGASHIAEKIFGILAKAEAKAHGVPIEQVHFHEVGAVDSIVDIISAAVCLDNLGITQVIIPKLCEGQGTVRCQHGILPIPVPAVANIVSEYGFRLQITDIQGELVTPTGAAIAATIYTGFQLPGSFTIEKIGIGAGKRAYERPSLLRAMMITPCSQKKERDMVCRLETNIDDCQGEIFGYVMEQLFQAGARDVNYTPVFMKKNRPAYQLNVICSPEDVEKLENIIFQETTTIGIRKQLMERRILPRESRVFKTRIGEAKIKVCVLPDGTRRIYPEYDTTAILAQKNGISYQEAYDIIKAETKRME